MKTRTPNVHDAIAEIFQQISGQWSVVSERLKQRDDEWTKSVDIQRTMGRILGLIEILVRLEPDNPDFRQMMSTAMERYTDNVVYMRSLKPPVPAEKLPKVSHTTVTVTLH